MLTGGATEPFNGEWLFIQNDEVVGRVKSCCMYCAWMLGHSAWPRAEMGHAEMPDTYSPETIMIRGKCSRIYWREVHGRERGEA